MRIQLSARKIDFPDQCVCCGDENPTRTLLLRATRTTGKRVIRTTSRGWDVPVCATCLEHARIWRLGNAHLSGLMLFGTALGIVGLFWHWAFAVGAFFGFLALGLFLQHREHQKAQRVARPNCGHIVEPARYLGWDGSLQTFDFTNPSIATELMARNSDKLVNVAPEHRALVVAKPTATTPKPALAQFDDAIRRIEAAKTPAGRRSALARSLSELPQDMADQLNLEASRIEVEAALEKVDGLKTKAAKLRRLNEALETIRADSVDDSLQSKQIKWIEDAIATVETET